MQVFGVGALELDDHFGRPVHDDGSVRLFGVLCVLELGGQIPILIRVDDVAQHIHKQITQESLLVLLFLGAAYIRLLATVAELCAVALVQRVQLCFIRCCGVMGYDRSLE